MDRIAFALVFISSVTWSVLSIARACARSDWTGNRPRTRNSRDHAHPMTLAERNSRRNV